MTLYIVLGILAIVILFVVSTYNSLVGLSNKVDECLAQLDAHLEKRADLVPNLVETVKGYAKHESKTLEEVIAARNAGLGAKSLSAKDEASNGLSGALGRLFAVAENYPQLKANENFLSLQKELGQIENEILQSRKYYNAIVKDYNVRTQVFPSNIIASMFHYTKREYLKVDESKKAAVQVKF